LFDNVDNAITESKQPMSTDLDDNTESIETGKQRTENGSENGEDLVQ
jgi:hypothetical protein